MGSKKTPSSAGKEIKTEDLPEPTPDERPKQSSNKKASSALKDKLKNKERAEWIRDNTKGVKQSSFDRKKLNKFN